MNIEIKILRNEHGKPVDKLADAESTSSAASSRDSSWLALRSGGGVRAQAEAYGSPQRQAEAVGTHFDILGDIAVL
jgi:hypothetical protein